jgi:hypothetical protein
MGTRWTTVLDLKLDGAGTVTGQVMNGRPDNMTPIKTGSFNRQAGTLRLEGEARNTDSGAPVSFTILGNLVGDSLKVNATFGTYHGAVALVRLAAGRAHPA